MSLGRIVGNVLDGGKDIRGSAARMFDDTKVSVSPGQLYVILAC